MLAVIVGFTFLVIAVSFGLSFDTVLSGIVMALVAAGFAYMTRLKNLERDDPPLPGNSRKYLDNVARIENVVPGGVFRVSEFGPELTDLDLQVDERHLYDERGFTWFELACDSRDGRYYLTFIDDDEVEISISGPAKDLEDLGLTETDYTNHPNPPQNVIFEGVTYALSESGKTDFYKNSDRSKKTRFRYWDYDREGSNLSVTVEEWPSGFEVHVSTDIKYHQITVYSNRGEE